MSKTALSEAAYDGKIAEVRALLKKSADADGNDEETYDDEAEGCTDWAALGSRHPLRRSTRSTRRS